MDTNLKKINCSGMAKGSAFILMIVLTSLLAIIAVMFMLSARMQKFSTSSMQDSKALDFAVETVVSKVSEQIAKDVPGNFITEVNNPPAPLRTYYQEYYDYPSYDPNNFHDDRWLANLEPEYVDVNGVSLIGFRHISDVFDGRLASLYLSNPNISFQNVSAVVIKEHEPIGNEGDKADADGDGVSDSRWVIVPGTSVKGQPVYAAVRVIDNAAMLNANTSGSFNPDGNDVKKIDGSSQLQIDFVHLAKRAGILADTAEKTLNKQRFDPNKPGDIAGYENGVLWQFINYGKHRPYDIGDELSLRNRFFLANDDLATRIEWLSKYGWWFTFLSHEYVPTHSHCRTSPIEDQPDVEYHWLRRLNTDFPYDNKGIYDPCFYDVRHIVTTYSLERARTADGNSLINGGRGMISLSQFDPNIAPFDPNAAQKIYNDLVYSRYFKSNFYPELAQIIANLKDYTDDDNDVTAVIDKNGGLHYGWEKPDMYITELVYEANAIDPNHVSYAIEIFKTTAEHFDPCDFRVVIGGGDPNKTAGLYKTWYPTDSNFNETGSRFIVITYVDPNIQIQGSIKFNDSPVDGAFGVNPDVVLKWDDISASKYDIYIGTDLNKVTDAKVSDHLGVDCTNDLTSPSYDPTLNTSTTYYWRVDVIVGGYVEKGQVMHFTTWAKKPNILNTAIAGGDLVFDSNTVISLQRWVADINDYITVDEVPVPAFLVAQSAVGSGKYTASYQRDMSTAGLLKRVWDVNGTYVSSPTLGRTNTFIDPCLPPMEESYHGKLTNIGDIGRVLKKSLYVASDSSSQIEYIDGLYDIKIDLEDPNIHRLFKYLEHITNKRADKIKGRININTAPWYVIARLPWVSERINADGNTFTTDNLAKAIVAYRDKNSLPVNYSGTRYNALPVLEQNRLVAKGIYSINENRGFENIGELNYVIAYGSDPNYSIRFYEEYSKFTGGFPYIGETGVIKDVSVKRDLIFSRISDLVTVRSDVFTAYILVRIGTEGPQRRVIAILDRSDVLPDTEYKPGKKEGIPKGKVKIVAIQPVMDPR
jgi:hypothetical protein